MHKQPEPQKPLSQAPHAAGVEVRSQLPAEDSVTQVMPGVAEGAAFPIPIRGGASEFRVRDEQQVMAEYRRIEAEEGTLAAHNWACLLPRREEFQIVVDALRAGRTGK